MADYTPPTENLPIFDKLLFSSGEEYITQNDADKRYLRYPNAQGTENLQSVNIGGTLNASGISNFTSDLNSSGTLRQSGIANFTSDVNSTGVLGQSGIANFSSDVNSTGTLTQSGVANFTNDINSSDVLNIYDATLPEQNKICLNLQSTGVPLNRLRFLLNSSGGAYNSTVRAGDIAMCYGTIDPNACSLAIAPVGATSCGLRMSREGIGLGSGGTGVEPNNRIIITPSIFSIIPNGTQQQVDISNNVVLNNGTGTNRQITSSYLNLNDTSTNTLSGRMYGSGTNIAMDNNIIMSNASSTNRQITSSYFNVTSASTNLAVGQIFGSGQNINVTKSILMNGSTGTDRQITTSYLNLTDASLPTVSNVCQIYGSGTGAIFDNNTNDGYFLFASNNSLGTQTTPLQFSSGTFIIGTTSSPTYTGAIPATSDNTTKIPTTQWVQSVISPLSTGRTQTVSFTAALTTPVVPTGVIGFSVKMVGRGGYPGANADTGVSNYSSGGTGGGASSIISNGMIPIVGGVNIRCVITSIDVTLTIGTTVICSCSNGNNGGNASGTSGGSAGASQLTGSSNSLYGSFSLLPGAGGVPGIGNVPYQSITGVPTITLTNQGSPQYQRFTDGERGCAQRYAYVSGNGYPTSSPEPAPAIIYLTYYYI